MAVRAPKNKLVSGLQTQGNEFIYSNGEFEGEDYVGPYYFLNNKPYPGIDPEDNNKNFPSVSIEVKSFDEVDLFGFRRTTKKLESAVNKVNKAVGWATTAYYTAKRNVEVAKAVVSEVKSWFPVKNETEGAPARTGIHYYSKKVSDNTIKEISSEDFKNTSQNPAYINVSINFSSISVPDFIRELEEAEKKIPGIKLFLGFQN